MTAWNDLWDQAHVAFDEDEAHAQAIRQYEPFDGKPIDLVEVNGTIDIDGARSGWGEIRFAVPVRWHVVALDTDSGWDGDVLYPEWRLLPARDSGPIPLANGTFVWPDQIDCPTVTAPGIGTPEGFADGANLIWPDKKGTRTDG